MGAWFVSCRGGRSREGLHREAREDVPEQNVCVDQGAAKRVPIHGSICAMVRERQCQVVRQTRPRRPAHSKKGYNVSKYVVKFGDKYADGLRGWTRFRDGAFRFVDRPGEVYSDGREWAEEHAASLGDMARVVRLVPRKSK